MNSSEEIAISEIDTKTLREEFEDVELLNAKEVKKMLKCSLPYVYKMADVLNFIEKYWHG